MRPSEFSHPYPPGNSFEPPGTIQILSRPRPPFVNGVRGSDFASVSFGHQFQPAPFVEPASKQDQQATVNAVDQQAMAGYDEPYAYANNVLDDVELPRQTTLEEYVKYKPARRKKGESPKRPQLPASTISKDTIGTVAEEACTPKLQPPTGPSPPAVAPTHGAISQQTGIYDQPSDPVDADGEFRYREFENGNVMILQWQTVGMRWINLGVVDKKSSEAFQQFEKTWQEYPQYQLHNGQFDRRKYRSDMELAIRKVTEGIKSRGQGASPMHPAPPPTTPASTQRYGEFHPSRPNNDFKPYAEYISTPGPLYEASLASHQAQLLQSFGRPSLPLSAYSGNRTHFSQLPASSHPSDPFVSMEPASKHTSNPSETWLREHDAWKAQESQSMASNMHHKRIREYELYRGTPARSIDGRLTSPAPSHGSGFRPPSIVTPVKSGPPRDDLRRTVLHDPYRNPGGQSIAQFPSSTPTRPASKPDLARADIPSLWPSTNPSEFKDFTFPKPVYGTQNPLPLPLRASHDPWGVQSSKPGRTPLTATFLEAPIKSADLDEFSPHLHDDDLRDYYPPVDFTASPLTAKDALHPNTGKVPTVVKPVADSRPVSSWNEQTSFERAKEAAAQKEREYNERLDTFWTSGLRSLPALCKQVDDVVDAHNAKGGDKVESDDEMLLWAMLRERVGEYVDESVRRRREEDGALQDDESVVLP